MAPYLDSWKIPLTFIQDHRDILIAAGIGGITLAFALDRLYRPKPIPGIPHNPITSRKGDAPEVEKQTALVGTLFEENGWLVQTHDRLGAVCQMILGPFTSNVMVCDVQEYEDLLLRSRSKFLDRTPWTLLRFQAVIPGAVIANPMNDLWKRHRRLVAPLMTSKYLNPMSPVISTEARKLVEYWAEKSRLAYGKDGKAFEATGDLAWSIVDTFGILVLNRSPEALSFARKQFGETPISVERSGAAKFRIQGHPLASAIDYLDGWLSSDMALPLWAKKIQNMLMKYVVPRFRREMSIARAFIQSCMDEARSLVREARAIGADPPPANSFIGMIAENEGLPGSEGMPDWEIQDEALVFLFAAQESIATALGWGVKYLADVPEVQRRLRAELLALENYPVSRGLTYQDVCTNKTPYLEAVVSEILRCAPPTPGDTRITLAPMEILGHQVPAGVQLILDSGAMARRATKGNLAKMQALDPLRSDVSRRVGFSGHGLWDDEDILKFKPERWLDSEGAFNPKAGYSIPFGLGPRACPGKQLALAAVRIYIATINLEFFLDRVPEPLATYRGRLTGFSRVPVSCYIAPKLWAEVD